MTDPAEHVPATAATHPLTVTDSSVLVSRYHRDGDVVLAGALRSDEVRALREEAVRICRGELGAVDGVQPPGADEPDQVIIRRYLCIHFPHKLSELMRRMPAHPAIVDALTQLIGPNIKAVQPMLFIKSEGKPGQAWHQDELFIPTRDRSLTAAWIALDDATVENGCLWVLPGSHRPGVLYPDRDHHDPRFDCEVEAYDFPYRDQDAVPSRCPPAPSWRSTVTCCTCRCPTPVARDCAGRWSTTT